MKEIKELLYNDCDGLFERMRDGIREVPQEDRDKILKFSQHINEKLKEKEMFKSEEVIIALDVVHLIGEFAETQGAEILANQAYENMLRGIEFEL